ncbi:MAG: hypothetical protein LUO89_01380 [Methanothrix sp.]|nr:hypothetical protein [Methanothrix sp.]
MSMTAELEFMKMWANVVQRRSRQFRRHEPLRRETQLITNWIGDDGWLSKFSWRNGNLADQIDVIIAKGYVTWKYVDGDDHKVDLVVWTEDIDGTLCQAANATVILPSRSSS